MFVVLFVKLSDCIMLRNQSIGAVNTIIRRPFDGKLIGYNTDCEACVTAIEDALRGTDYSLLGSWKLKTFLILLQERYK